MAKTYGGNPSANRKDAVRFELGDTKASDFLVTDEEIEYALSVESTVLRAAARVAYSLSARFARETTERNANVTIDHAAKQRHFLRLARNLKRREQRSFISLAGIDSSGKETKPRFSLGMHDNRKIPTDDKKVLS